MCGILVWIKKKGYVNQESFQNSLLKIFHRGPDSQKIFLHNLEEKKSKISYFDDFVPNNQKYNIAFGSTRFGTFDSKSRISDMPMISENSNYVISFNGDVYNYLDLREDLKQKNINFQTNVDTEVLLKGLIEEKEDFLKKINSDYAFVFLDVLQKKIIYSRDVFGSIPLFVFNDNEEIIFCSELGPIINLLNDKKKPTFNKEFYNHFLLTNEWLYDENSNLLAFNEIQSVKPGSTNTIDLINFEIKNNYSNSLDNLLNTEKKIDFKDLEYLLINSIKLRLQTDKNIGIFLSGGLDSSLIVTLYLKYLKKDFDNVNIYTSENYFNDLGYVNKLSSQLDFKFNEIKIGYEENIFECIDDMITKTCLPASTYGNSIGQYMMFKKMKELNKGIIITGHGGDQMFSGLFSNANASVEYLSKFNFIQFFYHVFLSNSYDQNILKNLLMHYLNKFNISKFINNNKSFYNFGKRFSDNTKSIRSVRSQQIYDIKSGNFATSNNLINFISMSNSVAVRSPLIDRNFLGFINNNLEDKFKYVFDRYNLRQILKKYEININKRKSKQGLRWRGQNMLNNHKDKIFDTIKSSSFYEKNSEIFNLINNEKKLRINQKDKFLQYYSLARFEKITFNE